MKNTEIKQLVNKQKILKEFDFSFAESAVKIQI